MNRKERIIDFLKEALLCREEGSEETRGVKAGSYFKAEETDHAVLCSR